MNEDYSTKQHTAKERYEKLKEKREQYLDRARECSELTIPALIPEDGFHYTSELYTPFQSVGARGVNNWDFQVTTQSAASAGSLERLAQQPI